MDKNNNEFLNFELKEAHLQTSLSVQTSSMPRKEMIKIYYSTSNPFKLFFFRPCAFLRLTRQVSVFEIVRILSTIQLASQG